MIASVDVQAILARSVAGELARGLIAEAAASGGRATQQQREQILLALVLQAIAGLVEAIARARWYALVLERQRAGVLLAAPVADITAYDAVINERLAKEGRDAVLRQAPSPLEGKSPTGDAKKYPVNPAKEERHEVVGCWAHGPAERLRGRE